MHKNLREHRAKKILFAVGGTGGHLFPAQALAKELKEDNSEHDILFAGGRLGSNPFFQRFEFPFREISSATPFRGGVLSSLIKIVRGIFQSWRLFREFAPDLIVGFGSFYSFPLLAVTRLMRIDYILVESNALPGKVNRLFSAGARLSALQFKVASKKLKGKTAQVKIPHWSRELNEAVLSQGEARKAFGLDPDIFTLLVFGGSQGAKAINEAALQISFNLPFQVVHLCGRDQDAVALEKSWKALGIKARVKNFEDKMHLAWKVADIAICRAGAGTCSEVIEHATPALMIPWPGASENHQMVNAKVLEDHGGAMTVEQSQLSEALPGAVRRLIDHRDAIKRSLEQIKQLEIEDLKTAVVREMK